MTLSKTTDRQTIGIILPMLSGFYMGEINTVLRQLAIEHDVNLVFIRSGTNREFNLPVSLNHIDALILVLHAASHQLVEKAIKKDIPVFSLAGSYSPLPVEQFFSNQRKGVEELYRWLFQAGHTKIGFCGDLSVNDIRERYKAFQKVKAAYNHPLDTGDVFPISNCSLSGGREAAVLYHQRQCQCTAMICATDHNAVGMMEQFKHLKISVPEQVAIVGVDNIFFGSHSSPPLTTADQQLEQLAALAFQRALKRMSGQDYSNDVNYVDQKIVVRHSCGASEEQKTQAPQHSTLRNLVVNAEHRSPLEIFENFYSQAENGFNAILDAQSLYGSNLDWACFGSSNSEAYQIESWVEQGMAQPTKLPKEARFKDKIEDFPFLTSANNYATTIIPVSTGKHKDWKLIAVVDSLQDENSIKSQSVFNSYLDMLSLFIERDELLATSNQNERKSKQLLQQLEVVSNSSNDGIWEWDIARNQFRLNSRMLTILGLQSSNRQQILSLDEFIAYIHPQDLSIFEHAMQEHLIDKQPIKADFRLRKSNDSYIWVRANGSGVYDAEDKVVRVIGSITDITEQRRNEAKIHKMAYYDALTGVANRRMITESIEQHIVENATTPMAVMLMDLNRFKMINDSFGHHVGDALLKHVTKQLRHLLAYPHQIARLGGDEFVFFCQVESAQQAYTLADKILLEVLAPMQYEDIEISVQGSLGFAMYPDDGRSSDELIKRADIAMYQAKKQGAKHPVGYCCEEEGAILNKLAMEHHLKRAMANGEITIHYQPLYSIADEQFRAVESLARWHSPELGQVPPVQFIQLAEETNLIEQLGRYIIHKVCSDIKGSQLLSALNHVSINISAKQIIQENFANEVIEIVQQYQIPMSLLCFEVTETAAISDFSRCLSALESLRGAGAHISLDDFGTGYSSLSLLKKLPINEIKIDRSFIKDVDKDESHLDFVSTITTMGKSLGFKVVLEGVETEAHVNKLKQVEAEWMQGYYFSTPLALKELEKAWLDNRLYQSG